ncbi:hypothetical protein J0X14_12875 [Muricauda sp. CAU 1633]|uniref:hypothetical protein n=1 Tax=Allomuricauda sp. CAU 1633 TaxID=2816036 RepID=UPI001A8C4C5F|nr:hypothetical protein [Muricauda sp. CAU 1633]MBO0323194.1 hypothetical protein [Muricauda sp. CAU 1633]
MNQPSKKWLFPLLFFLILSLVSHGQEQNTFEGPLQVGPYSGKATYQYIISELDTVLDGDFQLQKSNLETLMEKEDSSFLFSGVFDEGVANGPWQFQFGEFKTNSQSQVVDYEYRVLVSGRQEVGAGEMVEGKPDGPWTYTINQIKDSEIEKVLFKSTISFDNGVPQQSFQIENDSSVLVGRFLRNGLAHDEWSFYATEAVEDTENWFFEDGLLRRIELNSDGTSRTASIFDGDASDYQTIPLNTKYFALLDAVLNNDLGQSQIVHLLEQNIGYYTKMDEVLSHLDSPGIAANMKVRVTHYPLDSLQNATLEQIASGYKTAAKLSDAILKNSHLNIVKRTDPEALFFYKVTEKISQEFLEPLGIMAGYIANDIVQYQEIPSVLERLWPNGKPEKEIVVSSETAEGQRTFSLPSSEEFGYEGNDLLSIVALGTYARMSLEYIKGSLSSRLTNEEQLQMLNGLEEELIALNNALEQKIDSLPSTFPGEYKDALVSMKKVADSSLTTYSSIEEPNAKLEYGQGAKTCLSQLNSLASSVASLPQQSQEIQKKYTDAVWNPFMANVMEEEVKKRIVNAYEDVLIPYFITNIIQELQCDNAGTLNDQMEHAYQRMLELRDEDTKKLERKLRREKRPKEVLQLLHQQSTSKNQ